jgi:hypothetical protein
MPTAKIRITKQARLLPHAGKSLLIENLAQATKIRNFGVLYFINEEFTRKGAKSAIKAGITDRLNLHCRIKSHQTGNPARLRYAAIVLFYNREAAIEAETVLKRRLEDVKCQGGREWFYSDIDTLTGLASAIAHELQEQQIYASSARNVKSIRQELGGGFFGHLVYEIDSDDGPQSTDSLEPTVDVEVDETPQPVLDAVATQVAEGIWTRLCKAAGFGQ